MKINFKKAFCVLAVSALVFKASTAKAQVIEDRKERMNIGSGVEHVRIDRFTDKGFIDIDVIKLDSKNPYSNLIPLVSKDGVSKRAVLTDMMDSSGALAGINGDFFEVTKYPMALGSLVDGGKPILSTPEAAFSRNSFYINKDGVAGVGSLNNDIVVTVAGQKLQVNALNKLSKPYKALAILDEKWGPVSPGKNIGAQNVELLVANGKVIDKRVGGTPMEILPGTLVLSQTGPALEKFNVGDPVTIDYGSYKNLSFAIGGGNILIKNGQIPEKLSNSRAPRTAIGMDKANKIIYLVTVDGRNNSSIGMGEQELAEFLKYLGVYNGINLDGGGSTTLGIKYSGDSKVSVKNTPSDGKQRPIVSGVGIKSQAPLGQPSYLTVKPSHDEMFAGFAYPVEVKVYDQNHNRISVNQDEITLSSDFGTANGKNFTPNKKGFGQIVATYKGISGASDVHFHSDIKEFSLDVGSLQIDNGKVHIFETIYGLDDMGYKKKIPASMVSFQMSPELGTLENNKFTARAEGMATGTITASFKDLKRIIPVTVSYEKTPVPGFENIENKSYWQSLDDKKFIVGSLAADEEGQNNLGSLNLNYSFTNYDDVQSAGINFNEKINLGNPSAIGLWIKGDGKGCKVQGVFTDENGTTKTQDLVSKVSFSDWKYVEANIPAGLSGNVTLDRIQVSLVENRNIQSNIKFTGLQVIVKPSLDWESAKGSSKLIDSKIYAITEGNPTKISLGSAASDQVKAHLQASSQGFVYDKALKDPLKAVNSNYATGSLRGLEIKKIKNTAIINLTANKNGLRSANPGQYQALNDLLASKDSKNVIITMNMDPENIPGSKEKSYFLDKIDQGIKAGKNIFIVLPGSSTNVKLENGYRKVTLSPTDPGSLDIFTTDSNMAYILTRF